MERAGTLGGPGGQAGQGYQAVLIDPTLRVGGREQGAGDSYDNTPITEQDCRIRRLTPLECERLQGFPDDWTEGHADTPRYRMLGNAVAVPVAEWIARRIAAADALLTGKDP
jgi:DNA (cytosine-5)-methyltransferase 1